MKILTILAISFVCACAVPKQVRVIYQRGLPQPAVDAIHGAVAQINEQLGCDYLESPRADHVERSNFFIMRHPGKGGGQARAQSEDFCSIYFGGNASDEDLKFIMAHELLHCLGQGHVDKSIKGDLMNPYIQPPGWTFGEYMKGLGEKYCSKYSDTGIVEQNFALEKEEPYCGGTED